MLDVGTVLAETREAPPCGPNLEHDLSFFELEEAARGVEVALGRLAPPPTADPTTLRPIGQIHAQIAAAFASDRSVPSAVREAHDRAGAVQAFISERVGAARALDFTPLIQPLECLL